MWRIVLLLLVGCGRIGFGLSGDNTPGDGAITDGTATDGTTDGMSMSTTGLGDVAGGSDDASGVIIESAPAPHENNRLLIAAIHWVGSTSSVVSVTDTAGNLYQPLTRANTAGGSVQLWFANGTFAGSATNKVMATFALPTTKRRILVHEYPKVASMSGQATGFGNAGTAITASVNAAADSLVVTTCFTPGAQVSFAPGASYELGVNVASDSQMADRAFATAGSASGNMMLTPAATYVMAMAVFER